MAEYALGAHGSFKGKAIYLNMIINISPACDCYAEMMPQSAEI